MGRSASWGRERIEEWTQNRYHQVSDEVDDSWVWDGLVQDAVLALYCGLAVAQQDDLPTWNPGDEFEAARKHALAELDR